MKITDLPAVVPAEHIVRCSVTVAKNLWDAFPKAEPKDQRVKTL